MCSSSDDVDDEDCEKMENTMCSSSDDVDDEDYVEKWKNGKHNVFFLWWCWWQRLCKKMENTMCSSSDDVDDEDYVEKWKNGKHNVFFHLRNVCFNMFQ